MATKVAYGVKPIMPTTFILERLKLKLEQSQIVEDYVA